ncbi:hypothetical protein [Anaerococcus hydrogenalis]|uniref:hypothetical protein n=1 Tax=Anaerococcus hydrogenalis TaxID=33029 RepID=UPI00290416D2|nr:hypothetical protein [Anaerococcus hydrogenalis]MDU1316661.1 hypothetical protein [Anaerococcus hydrogenalis]
MISSDNKYIFETTRGDEFNLYIFIDKMPITNAKTLTSTIRRNEDSSEQISSSCSVSGSGKYVIKFSSSQMKNLYGTYAIDVELSDGNSSNCKTLVLGSLIVNKDVTY